MKREKTIEEIEARLEEIKREINSLESEDKTSGLTNEHREELIDLNERTIESLRNTNESNEATIRVMERVNEDYRKQMKGKEYVLKLEVQGEALTICFYALGCRMEIGHINHMGCCCFLSSDAYLQNYKTWRKNGMKFDDSVVEWRGGEYCLINNFKTVWLDRIDIKSGGIYNFSNCASFCYCEDPNIIRFERNNRPVIFQGDEMGDSKFNGFEGEFVCKFDMPDTFIVLRSLTVTQIKKVIHSKSNRGKGATVVFFDDGDKIIVKKGKHEREDAEKAILWAYFIKNSGKSRTQAKKMMKRLCDES